MSHARAVSQTVADNPSPQGAIVPAFSGPVLLVQDKQAILSLLSAVLGASGIEDVDLARSGAEAVRLLQGRRYGLVICERFMHPISGIDLRALMNARPEWARIPFICVLSSERQGDEAKRQAGRVLHCLTLPMTPASLRTAIARATADQASA